MKSGVTYGQRVTQILAFVFVAGGTLAFSQESPGIAEIKKAAEAGDVNAQHQLGCCYFKGEGVKKNSTEAERWIRKSAEQGNPAAQFNLFGIYSEGVGVGKDNVEAVKWLKKSADQNNMYAQHNLGYCYNLGIGVAKDYTEAVKWFRKSAEQGNIEPQYNLGFCYYKGEGVLRDYTLAYMWFNIAAESGHRGAAQMRQVVSDLMTKEQIAEAQRLGREWKPAKTADLTRVERNKAHTKAAKDFKATGIGWNATVQKVHALFPSAIKSETLSDERVGLEGYEIKNTDSCDEIWLEFLDGRLMRMHIWYSPNNLATMGGNFTQGCLAVVARLTEKIGPPDSNRKASAKEEEDSGMLYQTDWNVPDADKVFSFVILKQGGFLRITDNRVANEMAEKRKAKADTGF